ncbi:hypothetical protein JZ751_014624 [Albula glossodonta]|uniref:COMM domain-containing protein n=1 Tax=Albula glossodonta TaxID=121402 RepID=A0A8T2MY70_9TELE|nr:hypothetical protein JZ751_014624 [Albula glossodonta]
MDRFLQQVSEFAGENGMSAGPLRNLVKSVLLVPHGALKKGLNADQVKEDLITLGLNEDKALHFANQWKIHYPVLSRLAVGQTLMVNQLVDMEWKFGELTLPQFYNFLHEMERAKASMDCFS